MTDILKRLNTVVTYAEHGVDPYWIEIAMREIKILRGLIDNFCTADLEDIQCECPYLDCVCKENAYRAATDAFHEMSETWNRKSE